jgi:hypothetical protein
MNNQQGELWETPVQRITMDHLIYELMKDIGDLAQLRCRLYDLKGTTYKQCHADHQEVLTRIALVTNNMADRLGFDLNESVENALHAKRNEQQKEFARRVSNATVYSGGECGHQQRPTFDLDED